MDTRNGRRDPSRPCLAATPELLLSLTLTLSACGAGVAGVVASSGNNGNGSSAPAIVNLSLSATKRSPARIEFELQNAAAQVELRYLAPGDPAGSFRPMEHLSGLGTNPARLDVGSFGVHGDFRVEAGIDPAGAFATELEVAVVGQTSGSQRAGTGVGNRPH